MRSGLAAIASSREIALDYPMHSEQLHVNPSPTPSPFLRKGQVDDHDPMSSDVTFIEIFEHARRLGNAALLVVEQLSPGSPAQAACRGPLSKFALAHSRTQEILRQYMAALEATAESKKN